MTKEQVIQKIKEIIDKDTSLTNIKITINIKSKT